MDLTDSNTDSIKNQHDSLDQYMQTLAGQTVQPPTSHEIFYANNDNEEHLEEFYGILSKKKQKEEEAAALERKKNEAPPKSVKSIAPSLSHSEIDNREHIKDIYVPDEVVSAMTLEECIELKKRLNIETFGTRVPRPISSFLQLSNSVPKTILARIDKMGFFDPTPVQCQAIPCILQGRNTIILSETGSGKTISYLIPVVVQILNLIKQWKAVASKKSVYAVILTLNRELCHQIYTLVLKLCKNINLRIVLLSTGVDKTELFKSVLSGCELAICTPARLIDLISLKGITMSQCRYFVVDEADKMFTTEYEEQTQSILNLVRDDTLMVFVSASTTDEIHKKIKSLVRNAITVKVGVTPIINLENIDLKFLTMFSNDVMVQKRTWLADNITHLESQSQTIIFCNTRQGVEQLYRFLSSTEKTCCMIHGDMQPSERHDTLTYFRKGYFKTLIATDLVCRGVDIPSVGCVVNFDAPKHFHTFLHRVGRCGRANTKGVSYVMFSKQDNKLAAFIVHYLESVASKTSVKTNVPDHLKKFAMTYSPFKHAKRMGIDFVEFVARGNLMKESGKKERQKRPIEDHSNNKFVPSKNFQRFGNHPVVSGQCDDGTKPGKEYNATDEISSSSEDDQ